MTNGETPEEVRERRGRQEEARLARALAGGVPTKYLRAAWEEMDREESRARAAAVQAAVEWTQVPEPWGIYLAGPKGIGKTRLAATAALAAVRRRPVRWVTVTTLMQTLSLGFGDPERERAIRSLRPPPPRDLQRYSPALVLDDLDKVRPTAHQLAPVFDVINAWVENELPLIVTTNKTLEDLAAWFGDQYGPPIASRLAEHCAVFEIQGRDRRLDP